MKTYPPAAATILGAFFLSCWCVAPAVHAQFTYVTNNGAITITKYTGPGGSVSTPSTTNGLPVTMVGAYAFDLCTNGTSVTIPGTVTNLGDHAISYCSRLSRIYFRGSAPGIGLETFSGFTQAILYYLPGTVGWGPTLGGRPTALWLPEVQTTGGSFGVRTNRFGFNIAWASGRVVAVEACTNLANPTWSPLRTNTRLSDSLYVSDPE